jgi:hypothetical protein
MASLEGWGSAIELRPRDGVRNEQSNFRIKIVFALSGYEDTWPRVDRWSVVATWMC